MSYRFQPVLFCLCLLLFVCGFAVPAAAQCPPRTTVSDTMYNADGSLAAGRVVVAWPTFAIGPCQVVAGQATVAVTAGALSVQLYSNAAATPAGTSYRVTYYLQSGKVSTEYWVVPTSATPVTLATVRSPTVPVPTVMFSQAQVTNLLADLARKVELPSPCPAGKFLQSSGSAAPPQVACVDGAGGGAQHKVNGVNLAVSDPVNFQDSATVAFSNPSAGNIQAAVKDASLSAAKLNVASPNAVQLSGVGDTNIAAGALSPNRISGTAEVQSNKGAANGYASLNASTKVEQDPANAQTTAAAAKIPLADGAGKIADGWLSSNVSLLGSTVDLATEVTGTLTETRGGTNQNTYAQGDMLYASSANTLAKRPIGAAGRYLRSTGTVPDWSSVAAGGAGPCTNQFVRSTNDNATPTCASVAGTDFANQSANQIFSGPASGGTAAPGFRALVKADTPATTVHTDQANTYSGGALQDMSANKLALPAATTLPASCTANKEIYVDTDATPAGQQVYLCNSAGTGWNLIGDGGASGSNHNLLSSTHSDTTAGAVARGDLVVGIGATPKWERLAIGAANKVLGSDGIDATWTALTLASAQFANQGTTTQVLHGNAAGNPSWSAVSLTADVTGILGSANGGTGNGFTKFSGPATSEKTFTLPNVSATVLTDNAAVTPAQGGTGANNTATSGRYLHGDGMNFVTSSVAAGGAGSCTNQFVRAANDNAAPTCASVSGSDFANQNANTFLAGPTSGSAAAPTFRAINQADINTLALLTPWNKRFSLSYASGGTSPSNTGADVQAITTGTGSYISPGNGLGGTLNCASGATSGNDCLLAGNVVWRRDATSGERTNLKARWRGSIQETTLTRWWGGFTDQGGTTMAGADNPAGNYAAFRFSTPASETTFKCVTKDNTTQNVVDSTVTITAGQSYEFRIEFDDTAGTVSFYIDGTARCSSPISANLPLDGTNLRFGPVMAETATTSARNYRVTWLLVLSDI